MSDAKTSRLGEINKPAIDLGIADNFHKLILPHNTTANLAQITPETASVAYDTTLDQIVVNNGSGFIAVPATGANTALSNLTSPTAVNQDLVMSGNQINVVSQIDNITISPGVVHFSFTASGTTVILTGTSHIHFLSHGLINDQAIQFSVVGGSLPTPLSAGVTYYADTVVTGPTNNFAVRATPSGSVIPLLSTGSGTVSVAAPPTTNYNNMDIGASLVPLIDATMDLGDSTARWANVYASSLQYDDPTSTPSIDLVNGALRDSTETVSLAWDSRYVQDSSTTTSIDWQNRLLANSSGTTVLDWSTDIKVTAIVDSPSGGLYVRIADGTNLNINQDVTTASPVGLAMFDQTGASYVGWRPPNVVTTSKIWALPVIDGADGFVLTTDGSGNTSWSPGANVVAVRLVTTTGPIATTDRKLLLEDANVINTNSITLPVGVNGMTFTYATTSTNQATWSIQATGPNVLDAFVATPGAAVASVTFLSGVWYNI